MKTMTRKWFGTGVLSLGLLLAAGIPAAAKNSRTINIDHAVFLQGKNLPAGRYKVEWQTHSPEATVQFLRNRQLVVSTEGQSRAARQNVFLRRCRLRNAAGRVRDPP